MEPLIICPTKVVPGAKVMFVGEAPGREECAQREGFVGPAGRVLQRATALAGLEWSQCTLSNVSKRPPDGGYSSDHFRRTFYETSEIPILTKSGKPSKRCKKVVHPAAELTRLYKLLKAEVLSCHPNVVVSIGAEATWGLTGHRQIHDYRGSVLASTLIPGQKVIPVVHPAYIQRGQWSDFWPLVYDLKKVKREMEFPEIRSEPYTEILEPTLEQVESFLGGIDGPYSLDIETRGGGIACVGIGKRIVLENCDTSRVTGLCIPIQTTRGPYWSLQAEARIWQFLVLLFKGQQLLVGQNLVYDLDWLRAYGVRPSGILMDTMTAHCFLYPEWTQGYKGLDFITSFYLDDVPFYKHDGKTWGHKTANEDLWRYNLKDVVQTLRASEKIQEQLIARRMWKPYREQIIPLTFLALEMMEKRLPVNENNRELLDKLLESELWKNQKLLTATIGYEINTASPKQVQSLLYTTLGLPIHRKRGKGTVTSDENTLRELRTQVGHPILDLLIASRHLTKRKSSFIDIELEE